MPKPMTPQRKPVLRQKSPLSNETYFASPASNMPGTFPSTPPAASPTTGMPNAQFSTVAYATTSSPSTNSKSPKRPSSIRNFLSFKALRRSYDNTSPDASGYRPSSPSTESTTSSLRPSLNKKSSGSFWKRKSSMGMTFGKEGESGDGPTSPGLNNDTVLEEEGEGRSPTPGPGSDFPTMKKRKSGTFWRRKSSATLASTIDANGDTGVGQNSNAIGTTNGEQNGINGRHAEDAVMRGQENETPLSEIKMVPTRSWSPPPQIPDFVGGGAGLGADDMFKDIN